MINIYIYIYTYIYLFIGLDGKYPLLLYGFNEAWIFSMDFRKTSNLPNFMKILRVGAEMFHEDRRTDRQTDIAKLVVGFRNVWNPSTALL